MATTFLKRQKEMKRLEKQREKAERRAQLKFTGGNQKTISRTTTVMFSATIPHSLTWLNLTSQSPKSKSQRRVWRTAHRLICRCRVMATGLTEIVELLRGYGATK